MAKPFNLRDYIAQHPPKNGRFWTMAIDGRAGAGKTTLMRRLEAVHRSMYALKGDDYFEPFGDTLLGGYNEARFFSDVVSPLLYRDVPTPRRFEWTTRQWTLPIAAKIEDLFAIERCFVFDCAVDWDVRIWVDIDPVVALDRVLRRDAKEFTWAEAPAWYVDIWRQWQLREDAYIARLRPPELADVVVDGAKGFDGQIR